MIFDLLCAFYYSYCTSLNLPHNDYFWPSVHYQTARKVSQFRIFSGPYFPISRLNTDSYSVYSYSAQIRENTDQKNFKFEHLFNVVKKY